MSMTFSKLLWFNFSRTFPGLEMTILKFHDFSRFSMTVRTPCIKPYTRNDVFSSRFKRKIHETPFKTDRIIRRCTSLRVAARQEGFVLCWWAAHRVWGVPLPLSPEPEMHLYIASSAATLRNECVSTRRPWTHPSSATRWLASGDATDRGRRTNALPKSQSVSFLDHSADGT